LVPNTSRQLQTTASEAHPIEGQLLLEEQTFNKEKSLIKGAGNRRSAVPKRE
jgi:hypothetical protein